MLICVCLRILASSRIPQYDLGRHPSFLRWFCHTVREGVGEARIVVVLRVGLVGRQSSSLSDGSVALGLGQRRPRSVVLLFFLPPPPPLAP
jgi:hypothetical protein